MNYRKGIGVLVIIVLVGGAYYFFMHPPALQAPAEEPVVSDHSAGDNNATAGTSTTEKTSFAWRFASAGETAGMPHTAVTAVVNGIAYKMGTFDGSCSEVGASGGIDGKGLLAGELSAAQCWFAGGGNEIGVFANEDGGFEIMVGELSEGEEGAPLFRGNFSIKHSIKP